MSRVLQDMGAIMKIAIEINAFGEIISKLVDYPGTPASQAEVVQWLMYQTDFKWSDYEHAPRADKLMYNFQDGSIN